MSYYFFNFYLATYVSLTQNESYQQSPEKTIKNGEHEKKTILTLESLESIHQCYNFYT